ncbi:hypothetical protein ATE47_18820 (plasmid) [Chryseobacterium sp. IHB B 17019]|jgi:hypothetical protein|uniref:S1C family serine protease n=1 Tax=Chryseobacterium sp. IHB B 17019 TaxID=1721091 RepID=UPI00071FCFFA|nr:S1C family serine protease [Chryseobacterium sp. IHB B 17019]ALR29215.1 hypothetical protein ATE47_01105 [Chryseobacterium sp. IHB B 17019]ALR32670.1 hypothetical protein ATE47_18820 [Chryseobacterium sp. IHB B 17019]
MINLEQYPYTYSEILVELLEYFSTHHNFGETRKNEERTIVKFCEYYKEKYSTPEMPYPTLVAQLCESLAKNNYLHLIIKDTPSNFDDTYWYLPSDGHGAIFKNPILKTFLNEKLKSLIFGFKYINTVYRDRVLPICHYINEDQAIGSSFIFFNGLATAKHCIEGASKISIKGIPKSVLQESTFLVHNIDAMDLIYIKFPESFLTQHRYAQYEEGQVLDEVLALGFPKVPGFHSFITAEKAIISSRYTASIGSIASIAEDIWMRQNLMLITAKIKAGNSGGPVINNNGNVVGISSNLPSGEGNYDDLGYGTVIPIKFLIEIITEENSKVFNKNMIDFLDFIE